MKNIQHLSSGHFSFVMAIAFVVLLANTALVLYWQITLGRTRYMVTHTGLTRIRRLVLSMAVLWTMVLGLLVIFGT